MIRFLVNLIKTLFTTNNNQHPVYRRPGNRQQENSGYQQQRYTPIESYYDLSRIPGTNLDIGIITKVLQTSQNEIITANQNKGTPTGCGHDAFLIDAVHTDNRRCRGIGGKCYICALEAAAQFNQGLITLEQAQALSLFCSDCQGGCDNCRRQDLCLRHSHRFEDAEGHTMYLCPDCLAKAENDKFFKKAMSVMMLPFTEQRED